MRITVGESRSGTGGGGKRLNFYSVYVEMIVFTPQTYLERFKFLFVTIKAIKISWIFRTHNTIIK